MAATVREWSDVFCEDLTVRAYSPLTLTAYRRELDRFLAFLRADKAAPSAKLFTAAKMGAYLAELAQQGLSNRSIARAGAVVRSFLAFLYQRGILPENYADRVPPVKTPKTLPRFLTVTQMTRWLDALPTATLRQCRDRAIVAVLYATGVRVSELCEMNWGDIDWENATITVTGKGRKTRLVPLGRRAAEELAVLRDKPDGDGDSAAQRTRHKSPVFLGRGDQRLNPRSVRRILNAGFGRATGGTGVTPHTLRHTFATHLLAAGADLMAIKEMLGHEAVVTTEKYTHVTAENLAAVHRRAFPTPTAPERNHHAD